MGRQRPVRPLPQLTAHQGPISARRERRGLATEGETNPAGAIEADPIRHLMTHITPCRSAPLTCGNAARLLETAPWLSRLTLRSELGRQDPSRCASADSRSCRRRTNAIGTAASWPGRTAGRRQTAAGRLMKHQQIARSAAQFHCRHCWHDIIWSSVRDSCWHP